MPAVHSYASYSAIESPIVCLVNGVEQNRRFTLQQTVQSPRSEELLWLSVQTSKHPSTHMLLTSYRENHTIKSSSWEKYNFRCLTPSQSQICVWQNEASDVRNIRKIRVTVRNLYHHWHSEISEGLPAGLIIGLNYIYLWTPKKEHSCTKHF